MKNYHGTVQTSMQKRFLSKAVFIPQNFLQAKQSEFNYLKLITNTLISICVFNLLNNMHLIQLWSRSFVLSIINEKRTEFISLKICTFTAHYCPFLQNTSQVHQFFISLELLCHRYLCTKLLLYFDIPKNVYH